MVILSWKYDKVSFPGTTGHALSQSISFLICLYYPWSWLESEESFLRKILLKFLPVSYIFTENMKQMKSHNGKNLKSLAAVFLAWFCILTAVRYHDKIIGNYENQNFKKVWFSSFASDGLILEPIYQQLSWHIQGVRLDSSGRCFCLQSLLSYKSPYLFLPSWWEYEPLH